MKRRLTNSEQKTNTDGMQKEPRFDEISYWSEVKLDIQREYAAAYSRILTTRRQRAFYHVYIDAFAGWGLHISKSTGEFVPGSPLNALNISPPFREYHLIDINAKKVAKLRSLTRGRADVFVHEGDANRLLLEQIFPRVKYGNYRRALCVLDPYGLHLDWQVLLTAGRMKSIDLFLSFQIFDANRNVLWRDPDRVKPQQAARMTAFWGDESWRMVAYAMQETLFGPRPEKEPNEAIARAFQYRLREVAGFAKVPEPMPMRNTKGAVVYYLFFASQKDAAENIVVDIFNKYRNRGAV